MSLLIEYQFRIKELTAQNAQLKEREAEMRQDVHTIANELKNAIETAGLNELINEDFGSQEVKTSDVIKILGKVVMKFTMKKIKLDELKKSWSKISPTLLKYNYLLKEENKLID